MTDEQDPIEILRETSITTSSLMVNVEFLELVDRYGEDEVWEILGKLKDLLE